MTVHSLLTDLLVVAVPALDLALAAALEVLLHLHLHADLVARVRVQRAPRQQHLKLHTE